MNHNVSSFSLKKYLLNNIVCTKLFIRDHCAQLLENIGTSGIRSYKREKLLQMQTNELNNCTVKFFYLINFKFKCTLKFC